MKYKIIENWFFHKGFRQGEFWAVLIVFFSALCDVLMRYLGEHIHCIEIVFFRFFFSFLMLLPFVSYQGIQILRTTQLGLHLSRAMLGAAAFYIDCYSVQIMALHEYTIFISTEPLFFLPLAVFILKEKMNRMQLQATIIGFIGMLFVQYTGSEIIKIAALIPILGAVAFAFLDLFTKEMVDEESTFSFLFYFSFGTVVLTLIPTLYYWHTPTLVEWGLLILLGVGANLIQFCLIKSFAATEASPLMPLRYLYFIFALIFGYAFFSEAPTVNTLIGAFFILLGAFFVSIRYETP